MEFYFEKDYLTISYDKSCHAIIAIWKIPATSEELKAGLLAHIPAMKYYNTTKIVTDTVGLGAISPDDTQWTITTWYPLAKEIGWSHWGLIIPQDVFTQMAMENPVENAVNDNVVQSYFDSIEAAKEWIKKF
ncbi:MAG TPA: hypothetical protein VIM65_21420 [Cyclobacteriaceae bacterium]